MVMQGLWLPYSKAARSPAELHCALQFRLRKLGFQAEAGAFEATTDSYGTAFGSRYKNCRSF
jgi:hypothetical protein